MQPAVKRKAEEDWLVKPDAAETFWQRFWATYRFRRNFGREAGGTHFWARSGQPSAIGKVARPGRLLNVVRFDHHLLGIAIDPHRDVCSEHDVQ